MKSLSNKIQESLNKQDIVEARVSDKSSEKILDTYIENVLAQKSDMDMGIDDFDKLLVKNKFEEFSDLDFGKMSIEDKKKIIKLSWTIWPDDKKAGNKEDKTALKSVISEGKNSDQGYIAYVLSIGVVNPNTGSTQFDWSIYSSWDKKMTVYLTSGGFLLFDAQDTCNIGDHITLRNNDSRRLMKVTGIKDKCPCTRDEVMAMCKKHGYDYTPLAPYKKRTSGRARLSTSFSVKGMEKYAEPLKK